MINLFQFGLETDPQLLQSATASVDFSIPPLILWGLLLLIFFVSLLYVLRFFIRRLSLARQATFHRVTLLITLPKFRREEESERGPSKDQVKEGIAAAESFFSSLGGLRVHHDFKSWLLGRQDEFSFEIVFEKKLIKFFVTVPVELRDFLEQQLSAAYPDAFTEEVQDYNIFKPDGVILGSHLVLRRINSFPIKTYVQLDKDPLNAITNVLSKIPEGDGAAFQFLVRSSPGAWRTRGIKIASNMQQGMKLEEALRGKKKGKSSSWMELSGLSSPNQSQEPQKDYRLSSCQEARVQAVN